MNKKNQRLPTLLYWLVFSGPLVGLGLFLSLCPQANSLSYSQIKPVNFQGNIAQGSVQDSETEPSASQAGAESSEAELSIPQPDRESPDPEQTTEPNVGGSSEVEQPAEDPSLNQSPAESELPTEPECLEEVGAPSKDDPLIGTWQSQDPSVSFRNFTFEPGGILKIGYAYLRNTTITSEVRYAVSPVSAAGNSTLRAIDIFSEESGSQPIRTFFQIIKDGNRSILKIELINVTPGEDRRSCNATQIDESGVRELLLQTNK